MLFVIKKLSYLKYAKHLSGVSFNFCFIFIPEVLLAVVFYRLENNFNKSININSIRFLATLLRFILIISVCLLRVNFINPLTCQLSLE